MENIINFIQKHSKIIIIVLVISIGLIFTALRLTIKKPSPDAELILVSPTLSQDFPEYSPYPSIPPLVVQELKYPVIFNSVTIEFKPRSGTFLVYYKGPKEIATQDYLNFMNSLNLNPIEYRVDYRTLELISLPPAYQQENGD